MSLRKSNESRNLKHYLFDNSFCLILRFTIYFGQSTRGRIVYYPTLTLLNGSRSNVCVPCNLNNLNNFKIQTNLSFKVKVFNIITAMKVSVPLALGKLKSDATLDVFLISLFIGQYIVHPIQTSVRIFI